MKSKQSCTGYIITIQILELMIISNDWLESVLLSRGFPKIDHFGNDTRIVLEQNKFNNKLLLTGIEPATLGL